MQWETALKRTRLVLAQTPVVFKDVINLVDKNVVISRLQGSVPLAKRHNVSTTQATPTQPTRSAVLLTAWGGG
uniref:Uncharacterized protein n=1 Tax=Anguilla anguilla TaxID=7936 RepID=A0A0E9TPX8_ANGAN